MSITQRLVVMIILGGLMLGIPTAGVRAQTPNRDASACLTPAEVRSLLATHPLIEFDAEGTMPCTAEDLLALIAILEAIHRGFPRETVTRVEGDGAPAVGGATGSSRSRRRVACSGIEIPSILHIRHQISVSESRGELRPEASSQRATAVKFGDARASLLFLARRVRIPIPRRLASLLAIHGTVSAVVHARNVRTDGFEVGSWHGGANALKLKARYDLRIGIDSFDLTVPINNLKSDCTRWPFV